MTVLGACLLGAGCLGEAPRNNPLDPGSELFENEGGVVGHVMTRAGAPLASVEVQLIPLGGGTTFVTHTDVQGRFEIRGAPAGVAYQLQVLKPGYAASGQDSVMVAAGRSAVLPELRLNALPLFTAIGLRTIHISQWWPGDVFFLDVNAVVDDPDGLVDIDSVWLEIPALDFAVPLEAATGGAFEARLNAQALPTASLSALLGPTLHLKVADVAGGVTETPPQRLVRVIDDVPVALSPSGDALLDTDQPALVWEPANLPFAFTYRVEVFRDEVNRPVLVQTLEGLSEDLTTTTLPAPLPTGQYFWTVSVLDSFGNLSRSREAAFRVP